MEDVDRFAVLSAIPLFADVLDHELLDGLAHKSHVTFFPSGSVLMTEGAFGTSMFAIVEGTVAVSVSGSQGDHDVATLGQGDIVGEMSLLTGARRTATVTATTDVVALEITKFGLEAILTQAPELVDRFGEVLARRQKELDRIAEEDAAAHAADLASQISRIFPAIFRRRST